MNSLLKYLLEASVIMGILYIPYYLIFRKYTFFQINRMYLIGSIWIAFIIPSLNISFGMNSSIDLVKVLLDPVLISDSPKEINEPYVLADTQIIQIIYISGTYILFSLLLLRIIQLFKVIRRHGFYREGQINIVAVNKQFTPASFFNYVFISAEERNNEIRDHELVHVHQGHSYDIVFIELVKIIMWFNPFIWIYSSAIRNVHEYLADFETLQKGYDCKNYQHLIFENTFGIRLNNLMVNFNYSPLKKRLKMMTKNKSNNSNKWNYILVMPVLLISLFLFGMNITFAQETKKKVESKIVSAEKPSEKAFTIPDEMPVFKWGDEEKSEIAFRKYIAENLKYPEEALKKGINGKVFVQFIVNKSGKVVDVKVVRGVDPILDQEAVRVIVSSPDWIPGKNAGEAVDVSYTFPINFSMKKK